MAELRALGCSHGQGYFFARPVGFADLEPLLASDFADAVGSVPATAPSALPAA